jgi:hypothetical protein
LNDGNILLMQDRTTVKFSVPLKSKEKRKATREEQQARRERNEELRVEHEEALLAPKLLKKEVQEEQQEVKRLAEFLTRKLPQRWHNDEQ